MHCNSQVGLDDMYPNFYYRLLCKLLNNIFRDDKKIYIIIYSFYYVTIQITKSYSKIDKIME